MAIVKLQKVTLYGRASQRDLVLDELQQLGCLHLIDLPGNNSGKPLEDAQRQQVMDGIKYLQAGAIQNGHQHLVYPDQLDCLLVSRQALDNQQRHDQLIEELDQITKAIQALEPWGEFQLPNAEQSVGLRFWFYQVPLRQRGILQELTAAWQLINEDRQFCYVVVISPQEPEMPLSSLTLDARPLSDLRRHQKDVEEQLDRLQWERVALTRYLNLLQRDLNLADDKIARAEAVRRMAQDDNLFAIQGWAPCSTVQALKEFALSHGLAISITEPHVDEQPPTLLKNPQLVSGAQGAVTFYMTPAYKSWDPTWIVYGSFTLFFAMIMCDAGYSALLALGMPFVWQRLGSSEALRQLRWLLLALVIVSIAYGVLAGSYFGATPSAFEQYQLKLDGQPLVNNKTAMMLLSLGIGAFHLALANLVTFWRNLGNSQAFASLGWALALVGGFVFGVFNQSSNPGTVWTAQFVGSQPEAIQPFLRQMGMAGLVSGLGMVFLFSSSRPLFSTRIRDWLWRILDGLMGLTKISQAFGDTLSYLRLFALGLASAQLAVTFNDLAIGVREIPGLGMVLALLILVVGHSINIVLGIMGGVVHGLRLNCIEFFNWSLTDEGYSFRPFCKKEG